jgi:hypothetical protein
MPFDPTNPNPSTRTRLRQIGNQGPAFPPCQIHPSSYTKPRSLPSSAYLLRNTLAQRDTIRGQATKAQKVGTDIGLFIMLVSAQQGRRTCQLTCRWVGFWMWVESWVEGLGPRLWKSEQAGEAAGEQRKGPRFISSHLAKWWARKVYQQLIKLDPRRAFLLPLVLEAAFQSSFFQGMTVRQESRSGWEWYIYYIEEI